MKHKSLLLLGLMIVLASISVSAATTSTTIFTTNMTSFPSLNVSIAFNFTGNLSVEQCIFYAQSVSVYNATYSNNTFYNQSFNAYYTGGNQTINVTCGNVTGGKTSALITVETPTTPNIYTWSSTTMNTPSNENVLTGLGPGVIIVAARGTASPDQSVTTLNYSTGGYLAHVFGLYCGSYQTVGTFDPISLDLIVSCFKGYTSTVGRYFTNGTAREQYTQNPPQGYAASEDIFSGAKYTYFIGVTGTGWDDSYHNTNLYKWNASSNVTLTDPNTFTRAPKRISFLPSTDPDYVPGILYVSDAVFSLRRVNISNISIDLPNDTLTKFFSQSANAAVDGANKCLVYNSSSVVCNGPASGSSFYGYVSKWARSTNYAPTVTWRSPVPTDTSSGLFAYYPFDVDARDAMNTYNGTIVDATAAYLNTTSSKAGAGSFTFNTLSGQTLYTVASATSTPFDLVAGNNLTECLWIKPRAGSTTITTTRRGGGPPNVGWSLEFGHSGNKITSSIYATSNVYADSTTDIAETNTWNFVCATFAGNVSNVRTNIYVNGNLEGTAYGEYPTSSGNKLWIGNTYNGPPSFEGEMDEVKFWNRALTSAEITSLYSPIPTFTKNPIWVAFNYTDGDTADSSQQCYFYGNNTLMYNKSYNRNTNYNQTFNTTVFGVNDYYVQCGNNITTAAGVTTTYSMDFSDLQVPTATNNLPANASSSSTMYTQFSCNATDDTAISTMGFYLWNSTGDLVTTNFTSKSGRTNTSAWNFTIPYYDVYLWSCWTNDTSGNSAYAATNYTFTSVLGTTLVVNRSSQSPADLTSTNAITTGANITYNVTFNTTLESLNYSWLYYQSGVGGNCWIKINGICIVNSYVSVNLSTVTGTVNLDDNSIYPGTYPASRTAIESRVNSFYNLANANSWACQELKNISLYQYSFSEAMYNATTTSGTGTGMVRVFNISNPSTASTNVNGYTLATPNKNESWNHCHPSLGGNVCDKVYNIPINLTSRKIGTVAIPATDTMYLCFRGTNGPGGSFQIAYGNVTGSLAQISTNNGGAWSNYTAGAFIVHAHLYNGSEKLQYYSNVSTNISSNIGQTYNDTLDITPLSPIPPSIISPTEIGYGDSILVNYTSAIPMNTYARITQYLIYWNNDTLIYNNSLNLTYTINTTNVASGNYTIYVKALDNNSLSANGYSLEFEIDHIVPTITLDSPTSSYYNSKSVWVNITAADAYLSTVWFNNGTTNNITWTANTLFNFSEGFNNITAYANDTFGNKNSAPMVTFFVDSIYPTIDWSADTTPNGSTLSQNWIYMNTTWTDTNLASITFYVDGGVVANYGVPTYSYNKTGLTDGTHTYYVSICDVAGNCNQTSTYEVTFYTVPPTVAIYYPANGLVYNNYNGYINLTYVSPYTLGSFTINDSRWTATGADVAQTCYQEFANDTTECGQAIAGAYSIGPNQFLMNYTKPSWAMDSSKWQVQHGSSDPSTNTPLTYNITLPSDCWNAYPDILQLAIFSNYSYGGISDHNISPGATSYPQCYNGTDWKQIGQISFNNTLEIGPIYAGCYYNAYKDGVWHDNLVPGVNGFPVALANNSLTCPWYGEHNTPFSTTKAIIYASVNEESMFWDKPLTFWYLNNTALPEGHYSIYTTLGDSLGNIGNTTVDFTLDTTNPVISFLNTSYNGTYMDTLSIIENVSYTDANFKNISFFLYDSLGALVYNSSSTNSTAPYTLNMTVSAYGSYSFNATMYDQAGNYGTSSTQFITLSQTQVSEVSGAAGANTGWVMGGGAGEGARAAEKVGEQITAAVDNTRQKLKDNNFIPYVVLAYLIMAVMIGAPSSNKPKKMKRNPKYKRPVNR